MTLDRLRRQEWRLAPALRDYIKRPYFCPFCEHPVIEATKLEAFENMVIQWVRCDKCEIEWQDVFELVTVETVEIP